MISLDRSAVVDQGSARRLGLPWWSELPGSGKINANFWPHWSQSYIEKANTLLISD